jgi:hypothetical protein
MLEAIDPEDYVAQKAAQTSLAIVYDEDYTSTVKLHVRSEYLQQQFRKARLIENFQDVSFDQSGLVISYPYSSLYHGFDDLEALFSSDSEITPVDRAHAMALRMICQESDIGNTFAEARRLSKEGLITF